MIRLSLFWLALSLSSFPLRAALLSHDDRKMPDTSLCSPAETHSGDFNLSHQEPRKPLDPGTEKQWWQAVEEGDTAKVKEIVRHFSFDVDKKEDPDGRRPLHLAAQNGHTAMCQFLVEQCKADPYQAVEQGVYYKGWTPLHSAAYQGHITTCHYFVEQCKMDPHQAAEQGDYYKGWIPLHIAAYNGHTATCAYLLQAGKKNRKTKPNIYKALHRAAQGGHTATCEYLLEACKADPNQAHHLNHIKSSFFVVAQPQPLRIGYTEIVEMLFKEITQKGDPAPNEKDRLGHTALHYALQYKVDPGRIEEYLKNAQNVDLTLLGNHGKVALHWALALPITDFSHDETYHRLSATQQCTMISPLILDWLRAITPNIAEKLSKAFSTIIIEYLIWNPDTIQKWTLEATQALLKKGANVNQKDKYGNTPLYIAVSNGHLDTCEYLVEKCNADLKEVMRLLNIAVKKGHTDVCKYFIGKCKIKVNEVYNSNSGCTLLHLAAHYGQTAMCQTLIEEGADVNQATKKGMTPLHLAVQAEQTETYKYLVEIANANVSQADQDGSTPLHCAAHQYDIASCKYLIESKKIDVNQKDTKGNTPLHIAAKFGTTATFKCLVEEGNADVKQVNNNGETPLHIAASDCYNKSMCEYLLKAGADPNKRTSWWFGKTPLDIAKERGYQEIVALLQEHEQPRTCSRILKKSAPIVVLVISLGLGLYNIVPQA